MQLKATKREDYLFKDLRCFSCGKLLGQLEDKPSLGLIEMKCRRCKSINHFLFFQKKVYLVNTSILKKNKLLNLLPTDYKSLIMKIVKD